MIGRSIPSNFRMLSFGQPSAVLSSLGVASELVERSPVAGMLSSIDMQDLAGNKLCGVEVKHRFDDLINRPHSLDGMKGSEEVVGLGGVHRGLDDTRRHGVHPDALAGKLDRQRSGDRIEASLGESR